MSEPRKCNDCSAPAAFLSSRCEKCAERNRLAKKHWHANKVINKLATKPSYLAYRRRRLKTLEKRLEAEKPKL
jgi:transposase